MGRLTAVSQDLDPDIVAEVTCPHCDRSAEVSVPDREVDPTVSPYVAAFGEHSVVHCPAGHKFWVYYC